MVPSVRTAIVLVVLIHSAAAPDLAQSAGGGIWDAAVMPQPFDTEPFHPIKVPAWVQNTTGCGYTLSVMDGNARAAAAKHGVTISEMGFVDPFYAYYDSKLLKKRSPHVPRDRLRNDIAEYKKLGVRILGVYPPSLQGEVYETHPDWRRIATNTTEIPTTDMMKFPHRGMLCLLGPYGDFFIDVLAEIVTTFPDVDAFSFDGLHYGGVCYCKNCRDAYRKDAGAEIPNADMNDPEFRRYQHWADRKMEDLVRRVQTRLKGIKPDLALVTWTTNAGRWGHFLSIPRNMPTRMNLLLDAPDQEFWLDETNRGTTIVPAFANAYIWATTNHRVAFSEPYLLSHGNPYGKDSFPPHEILRRMMLALTYGAAPSIAVAQPANLQQAVYDGLDEVAKRKPWLTHKRPEPWAALVMSDNTRNFYGRSARLVEERYMANVLGAFRAAVEEHLPVAVINDWNLNPVDLARYKVLILPNTACLDDAQTAAVSAFVRGGGGLVASLDTSLFDEYGTPRKNFALADVFGVDYRGIAEPSAAANQELDVNFARSIGPDYWEKRKGVFDYRQDASSFLNQGKMKVYLGDQPVTFKGPAVQVAVTDPAAKRVGVIRVKATPSAPELPGVVTRTHGKGRVVYTAAGFDAGYYLYAYPYERLILRHAIEWAAPTPPPIVVDAPMCVHSPVMRQSRGGSERLIVHLFNDLNTTAHHAKPDDDVPLREEVVPIHDIRIRFAPSYRFQRIHVEPGGTELKLETAPSGTTVIVPRLEVHAMVVAELAEVPGAASPPRNDLHIGNLRVGKVLILGNSVTLHGPAPQIGWTGDWGMAASAREKDFVHLLVRRIAEAAGGAPEVMVKNIADLERQQTDYDLNTGLKDELRFEADLVIVAIGRNAPDPATDEAKTRFRTAFTNLLAELKRHGHPVIFVRSEFWPEPAKEQIMRRACEDAGGIFVDLGHPDQDETNIARSERKFDHSGVAGHPGDKGMQVIADGLWKAIQKQAGVVPSKGS